MDEHAQQVDIGLAEQHHVGAAAHDDAVLLLCEAADDLGLRQKERIARRKSKIGGGLAFAASGALVRVFEGLRGKAALFGGDCNQLAVIKRDAERFGERLADLVAAAAKLPADRNNPMTHMRNAPFMVAEHIIQDFFEKCTRFFNLFCFFPKNPPDPTGKDGRKAENPAAKSPFARRLFEKGPNPQKGFWFLGAGSLNLFKRRRRRSRRRTPPWPR